MTPAAPPVFAPGSPSTAAAAAAAITTPAAPCGCCCCCCCHRLLRSLRWRWCMGVVVPPTEAVAAASLLQRARQPACQHAHPRTHRQLIALPPFPSLPAQRVPVLLPLSVHRCPEPAWRLERGVIHNLNTAAEPASAATEGRGRRLTTCNVKCSGDGGHTIIAGGRRKQSCVVNERATRLRHAVTVNYLAPVRGSGRWG